MAKTLKYHLTITNNETGETLNDLDFCDFVGAVNYGKGCHGISFGRCSAVDRALTLNALDNLRAEATKNEPELEALVMLIKGVVEKEVITNEHNKTEKE